MIEPATAIIAIAFIGLLAAIAMIMMFARIQRLEETVQYLAMRTANLEEERKTPCGFSSPSL